MRPAIFVGRSAWGEIMHPKPIFGMGFDAGVRLWVIADVTETPSVGGQPPILTASGVSLLAGVLTGVHVVWVAFGYDLGSSL